MLLSFFAKEFEINKLKAMPVKFPFPPKPEVPTMSLQAVETVICPIDGKDGRI